MESRIIVNYAFWEDTQDFRETRNLLTKLEQLLNCLPDQQFLENGVSVTDVTAFIYRLSLLIQFGRDLKCVAVNKTAILMTIK